MQTEIEWVDFQRMASVSVTSRKGQEPLSAGTWLADVAGEQTLTVRFRRPIAMRKIRLIFEEFHDQRTQEFAVWASVHRGERHVEIVRQQFNFSPQGATREIEEYSTDLHDVSSLQIRIVPSIDGRPATAKLIELRVA